MAACLTEICHRILYNFWSVLLVRYLIALWGVDNAYETEEIKSVQELKAVHVLCMKHIVILETCLLIGRRDLPHFPMRSLIHSLYTAKYKGKGCDPRMRSKVHSHNHVYLCLRKLCMQHIKKIIIYVKESNHSPCLKTTVDCSRT